MVKHDTSNIIYKGSTPLRDYLKNQLIKYNYKFNKVINHL